MTGNPGLDKILLGLNGIIVLAAAGLVFYAHNSIKPVPTDKAGQFGEMIENSVSEFQKAPITLDEKIVNLYSREARLRFLSTEMNIVLFREADRTYVNNNKVLVYDALIDIAGNMKPAELNSVTGRILLENRIKNRVNKQVGRSVIKKIFFSKFVIQ